VELAEGRAFFGEAGHGGTLFLLSSVVGGGNVNPIVSALRRCRMDRVPRSRQPKELGCRPIGS
jgi:hypothetical protein